MYDTHTQDAKVPHQRAIAWENLSTCRARRASANVVNLCANTSKQVRQETLQRLFRIDLDQTVADESNRVSSLVDDMV